ncbi:rho GTPase-activating protein 32 [Osmerus mordax]|uniref:rho GTPase-activating protein 32 n=1 Tax=Osmerus mordax TaxID=8014 RepID=UPI00350F106C
MMESGVGAATGSPGLPGSTAATSHDASFSTKDDRCVSVCPSLLCSGLRASEAEGLELPRSVHPRERPDWEETISAMARSAEVPELRTEHALCSFSSTASMKVKNIKKLSFTKGHFPQLAECAHFHYENVDFGSIQLSLADEQSEATRNGYEWQELVYLVQICCQGRSWMVKRSYEDFRVLDKHLHLCIYDRRFSLLPELPRGDSLRDRTEAVCQMLMAYLSRLSAIADNKINCGPVLTWMEVENKGNHLLVHEESSINVPAIAAAHVIKRYNAQAADELSFEVGDIVSVIDMPPKEDTTWWRGKHGFQVGFFPSECVELINDKVPQSVTNSVPKPVSPCSDLRPTSWSLFPPYLEMESIKQDSLWVDPVTPCGLNSVSKKHGKLITFLRSFMKSRPSKQKLKQRGILRERVFGCDLGEHLLNSAHDVPQVLRSCTDFLQKHGVVDGIYRLSGIASNIQKLRHEFDSEQIPDLTKDVYLQDIHCVGSLCKLYFRELPNPLLTYQLYEKFSEAVSAATDDERLIKIHDVIQQLPPPHYRTLEFLMRHLSHLATFSYITNMHSKNLAIVWAPNLLRSKQIESACFSGTAAFMEVRIQSVVVEFILNHVDVLFSPKLSSLIREGAGHNSLSRPKSLLVSSPSTKLLTLEEAQARTQAQINSPVTADSKYIEVGEGPAALQGKFHTVIQFPTERKRPSSRKSPVSSWRSFFTLGKASSMSKRKLQRNPSVPTELKAMALTGGRADTGTLRSAKSEESLTSLHNVEGESRMYRPRRPRSSSDALSASFNGDLLDSRHHCNSYDNLTPGESDGDDGPIRVPVLISPPRCAGEDVDLSPPDIGMASLDFDPMSFQCSLASPSLPAAPSLPVAPSLPLASPGTLSGEGAGLTSGSSHNTELLSPTLFSKFTKPFPALSTGLGDKPRSNKLSSSYSYSEKPIQAVSPIKSGQSASVAPLSPPELFSVECPGQRALGASLPLPSPPAPDPGPRDSPSMESLFLRPGEPSLSQALQMELDWKLTAMDATDRQDVLVDEGDKPAAVSSEHLGSTAVHGPAPSSPLLPAPPTTQSSACRLVQEASALVPRTQEPPEGAPLPQPVPDSEGCPSGSHPHTPVVEETQSRVALPPTSSAPSSPHLAPPAGMQEPLGGARTSSNPPGPSRGMDVPPGVTPPPQRRPASPPVQRTPVSPPVQREPAAPCPAPPPGSAPGSPPAVLPQPAPAVLPQPPSQVPDEAELPRPCEPLQPQPQTEALLPIQHQVQTQPQPHKQPYPQPQPHKQPYPQPQPQPNSRGASAPSVDEPVVKKPWEAIRPVQPEARPPLGPPPAPPVRSIESRLATAALSQTEASHATNFPSLPVEAPGPAAPQHPPHPPRKPASLQAAYLYHHSQGDALPSASEAFYQQRGLVAQPSSVYHHRPDTGPPHLSYASKTEPQIPYSARDVHYSTLGPRHYPQAARPRGPPRREYASPGPGHRGQACCPADGAHVYPSLRRVHSLHAPPSLLPLPPQRSHAPLDEELLFYRHPVYSCPAYQAPQADYHVTQLQPYFENGRVQYRYSPYSGASPLDSPFYDVDPYGTVRLRHTHSFGGRDVGPGRVGSKAGGYHFLSRHAPPPGQEHGFVSRDMPPGRGSKGAVYVSWDPEEWEQLGRLSLHRDSRPRQRVKAPVMSQYDNVGLFLPTDVSGYDSLHLRSKSDPADGMLMAAEGGEGRRPTRQLPPDPEVLLYLEAEKLCQGNQGNGTAKHSSSRACRASHPQAPPLARSVANQQESSRREVEDSRAGGSRWLEPSEARSLQPRYETELDGLPSRVKTLSGHPTAAPPTAPPPRPDRSHSRTREPPDADRDYSYQRLSTMTVQSHYDNIDDFSPGPQPPSGQPPQPSFPSGPQPPSSHQPPQPSFPAPGWAYSTALGQGAFLPEQRLQRPDTHIHAE